MESSKILYLHQPQKQRTRIYFITILNSVDSITEISLPHSLLRKTINNCINETEYVNSVETSFLMCAVRPLLAHGNFGDGYHSPPLEPLNLDNIELGGGQQFHAIFSDMQVRGGSNFIINKLKANTSSMAFDLLLTLPRIDFVANYFMKLNILLLDVEGQGKARGHCENATALVKMRGVRYFKDDVELVKFTKMPMRINISVFKMHLDNLFNGDPVLSEVGNTIINDNQDLYLKEIIPGLQKALSQKFLDIANMMLAYTTYDEMFPL
uniref:Hemolymph juvenile hormone-binding protein n=1 Tax=Glossina pallidipes TaxID=7398 RepID=A0A1A9ZCY4_GLOPL